MLIADNTDEDAARRSGAIRSAAARSGMRGLGSPCCSDCAAQTEGLGDLTSVASMVSQSKALDWLLVLSLSIGAVAGGISIYDHFKKRRRFGGRPRRTAKTMQIPVQSMSDLVYGEDRAA